MVSYDAKIVLKKFYFLKKSAIFPKLDFFWKKNWILHLNLPEKIGEELILATNKVALEVIKASENYPRGGRK